MFTKRDCINGYIEKQEDTYHMSDSEKDLQEIAPPKPKRIIQQKAKKSVKQILARTRKKVAKAEQTLRSAKQAAENTKKKLLTIDKALIGKETQLLTEDIIESAPKNVQEHVQNSKKLSLNLIQVHRHNFLQLLKEKYFMVEQEAVVNHMRC